MKNKIKNWLVQKEIDGIPINLTKAELSLLTLIRKAEERLNKAELFQENSYTDLEERLMIVQRHIREKNQQLEDEKKELEERLIKLEKKATMERRADPPSMILTDDECKHENIVMCFDGGTDEEWDECTACGKILTKKHYKIIGGKRYCYYGSRIRAREVFDREEKKQQPDWVEEGKQPGEDEIRFTGKDLDLAVRLVEYKFKEKEEDIKKLFDEVLEDLINETPCDHRDNSFNAAIKEYKQRWDEIMEGK